MLTNKTRSTVSTTKTGTPNILPINIILKQSIRTISAKYSTSQSYYVTQSINLVIDNKPCKLKTFLEDEQYNKIDEAIQKYYGLTQGQQTATQLIEYYKYYNQSSILYQPNFFQIMYKYRELKKTVEYNKLKIILDLHESTQEQKSTTHKNNVTPSCTINILSNLEISLVDGSQQSFLIKKMNSNLEKQLGPNRFCTIEQLDQNYYFKRNNIDSIKIIDYPSKKAKVNPKIAENTIKQQKYKMSIKGKRHNSCQSLIQPPPKRILSKSKKIYQKKHQSMDNFCALTYDIRPYSPCGQPKAKLFQNWVKPSQSSKIIKKSQSQKYTQKGSNNLNLKQIEKTKLFQIKGKINQIKDRIRKQKELIQKKSIFFTNPNQIAKTNKKCNTLTSATDKFWSKKLYKQFY